MGITIRVANAPQAAVATQKMVMLAEIGATGTLAPDTLTKIVSEAQLRGALGASQGAESAASAYFRNAIFRDPTQGAELWVMGFDSTGWTVNTHTLTWTGTTTASGTRVLRIGPYSVSVPLANGDDPTAQALAADTAVNAANIPYTSSVLAGVQTITSAHVGIMANHVPVTIDLFAQETGVAGSVVDIVNNDDATGEPVTLTSDQIDTLRTQNGTVYWVSAFRNAGFRNALNAEMQYHWDNRNNYAQGFQSVETADVAEFLTFMGGASPTNLARLATFAHGNAPHYELEISIRAVAGILSTRRTQGRDNPGLVNFTIPNVRPPQWPLSDADLVAIRGVSGNAIQDPGSGNTAVVPIVVGGRLLNDLNQPDLVEQSVSVILARRWLSEQLFIAVSPELGDGLTDDSIPDSASTTSLQTMREIAINVLKDGIQNAYVFGAESDAADMIVLVEATTQVNIQNGIRFVLDTVFVKPTENIDGTVIAA